MQQPLKLLALSDFHSHDKPLELVDHYLAAHPEIDLIIIAGDITERKGSNGVTNVQYLHRLLQIVKQNHGRELFAVHGNNDSTEIFDLLEATGVSLHLQSKTFRGWRFTGIGGWGALEETVLNSEQAASFTTAGSIFVTHIPPRLRVEFANPPLMHICGHLHSVEKLSMVGKVPLIQLKTIMLGRGALIDLPDESVDFISL